MTKKEAIEIAIQEMTKGIGNNKIFMSKCITQLGRNEYIEKNRQLIQAIKILEAENGN